MRKTFGRLHSMAGLSLKHIFKTYAGNAPAAVSDFSLEIVVKPY
jgi:hypothetical protein